ELETYLAEILETGESKGLVTLTGRQSDLHIFEYRSTLIKSDGKPSAVRGIARNVTDQKMAEKALRKSEERYRRFFEEDLTGDFIALPDGKIVYCNPAFARIFGFAGVDEALRFSIADLYAGQADFQALIERLTRTQKLEYYEEQLVNRSGEPVYIIENLIGTFNESGQLTQFQGYIFDDTERKQLEKQLLQSHKLQSIGTLAGGIAHDFNNILSIISGHASLVEQGLQEEQNVDGNILAIGQAIKRGAHLVNQILTFARKADINFQSTNVNVVLEELIDMLDGAFPKTLEFELSLGPGVTPVLADQNQLHQAFLNICINARDAMPRGGRISIATDMISAAALRTRFPEALNQDYVSISISDTGTGMDNETLQRLFEPFFTTKSRGQGTGLGLAVVYGIVSTHQGLIDVDSAPGKGTTFHFYFPQTSEKARPREMPRVNGNIRGTETLLIVEDEEMLVELLTHVLTTHGYNVLTARDGEEAIQVFRNFKEEIDLVFSDFGLPKMNGWQAFLEMRQLRPKIPGIFASGFFDPETKAAMQEKGVEKFLFKPYVLLEVASTIRQVLDN
ncbi:MAG TPA: ATP-binding protein, partial [Calditrichia bacterium]|nr:ATP-binding protein [Calditrichia bacterium]